MSELEGGRHRLEKRMETLRRGGSDVAWENTWGGAARPLFPIAQPLKNKYLLMQEQLECTAYDLLRASRNAAPSEF
jgi:hypothetical protein